jgi:Outer membrane protein beta-barrel domain
MKKLVVFAIFCSVFSSPRAQETGSFGISAGINVANMSFKASGVSASFSSLVGFKGYVFYDLPLGGSFSLQNEFGYDGMGTKITDPNSGDKLTEAVNYLTLSILPKYNVSQTGLSFFAGPSLGFLLNAKSTEGGQSSSDTDGYNSIDLFGVVGAEYFFPMGLGITARYMGGLTNVAKGTTSDESAHNSAFSFTLAYKFNSGK